MSPYIKITEIDGSISMFFEPKEGRLDLGFCGSGYLSVISNRECVYKESLDQIRTVQVTTSVADVFASILDRRAENAGKLM